MEGWSQAPRDRLYHNSCWEALCRNLCQHPEEVAAWCAQPSLSAVEQAHVLAAAIRDDCHATVTALLTVQPDLDLHPVSDMPTALHTAARAGRLPMLRHLLARRSGCMDVCRPEDVRAHSLRITALDRRTNDLYVPQPPLMYNGRTVYVGHAHGHYIYYYKPQKSDKVMVDAGWCLSHYLGSANPDHRLCLGDPKSPSPPLEGGAQLVAGATQHSEPLPSRSSWWAQPWGKAKATILRPKTGPSGSRTVWSRIRGARWAEGSEGTDGDGLAAEETLPSQPPEPPPLEVGMSPEELGLVRVPHGFSVLEAAVSSGDEVSVRLIVTVTHEGERYPLPLLSGEGRVWGREISAGEGIWGAAVDFLWGSR